MKAFITSLVLLVAITAGAYYALETLKMSSKDVYSSHTGSVRL